MPGGRHPSRTASGEDPGEPEALVELPDGKECGVA
jgi:hypothetical protein